MGLRWDPVSKEGEGWHSRLLKGFCLPASCDCVARYASRRGVVVEKGAVMLAVFVWYLA